VATFPLLSSGAVSQYPTESFSSRSVGIIRFVDGSDQRFLRTSRKLRRWRVDLSLLTDLEVSALQAFFTTQKGMFSPFTFTDPATKAQVSSCRLANSEMIAEYVSGNANSTSFWIMETNG
jgi:hypothetical protein